MLNGVGGEFFDLSEVKKHVDLWHERYINKAEKIPSAKDLLESYYASVNVVHIPNYDRMNLLEKQVTKLHGEISRSRKESHKRRERRLMELNAENFMLFINKAFDHFTTYFTTPFNFVQSWFEINQVSTASDFPKGILSVALAVQRVTSLEGLNVWRKISDLVASCISLSAMRQGLPRSE